jgi:hypothetical protein
VSIELSAEIQALPGTTEIRDGWRGLLDFDERWTEDDADLWAPEWGDLPTGEPLTYGCEVRPDPPDSPTVVIRLLVVDRLRKVMEPGSAFTLRDGHAARASGTLVSVRAH